MPSLERAIHIDAPVRIVFELLAARPERMPDWWPSLELVERAAPGPLSVGSLLRYDYSLLNCRIRGELCVETVLENQHLLLLTRSGFDSAWDFTVTPTPGGALLALRYDYTMPGSVLGQLLNRREIEVRNRRDFDHALDRLKALAEGQALTEPRL